MASDAEASQQFAKELFARFPEWRQFASMGSGGLVVNVTSPTGDPHRTLRFWVEEGEPAVGFGGWHTHEGLWESRDHFLALVEAVVSDRKLFVARGHDAWWWSCVDQPADNEVADALTDSSAPSEGRVLSWSGAKDRVVRLSDLS